MVRQGSQERVMNCAPPTAGPVRTVATTRTTSRRENRRMGEKKDGGRAPSISNECGLLSAAHLLASPHDLILEPGCRNDEERRQEKAQQRVQPDQRDVEAAEAETDPDGAKGAMRFQENAPLVADATKASRAAWALQPGSVRQRYLRRMTDPVIERIRNEVRRDL